MANVRFDAFVAGLPEAAVVGLDGYVPLLTDGEMRKFVPPTRVGGEVNVADFGADPTGAENSSQAVEDAIDALGGAGVVVFPKGTFILENITIPSDVIFRGQGWRNTTLKLPPAAANPMFVFKEAARAEMSSFEYLRFEGNGTDGQDGIDFSLATAWEFSTVRACYFTNFRKALIGSQDDRRPYITETHFRANDIGVFVHNNHPYLNQCDFRDNRIGLSGDGLLYDMRVQNSSFVRNEYGIQPYLDGGSISQCSFDNCVIFGNYAEGARVGTRVTFSNCLLVHGLPASDKGIVFVGSRSSFIGGIVSGEGTTGFTTAAFIAESAQAHDITVDAVQLNTDEFFRLDSEHLHRRINVINCSGVVRKHFVYMNTSSSSGIQMSRISGNTISLEGNTLEAGDGVVFVNPTATGGGNIIAENTMQSLDANFAADGIRASARSSIVVNNLVRRTAGITLTDTDSYTVNANNVHMA